MIKSVMLIDDNKIDIFVNIRVIEKYDPIITTMTFNNTTSAVSFFEHFDANVESQSLPEAILLDINMPDMNGYQFFKASKVMKVIDEYKIAVYMLSSSSCPDDVQKAQNEPKCSGYIIKPLTIDKLKNAFDDPSTFAMPQPCKKII